MPGILDMPWVFAVMFLTIIAVVVAFVAVSLAKHTHTHGKS
jgi:hypothetical protein